MTGRGGSGQVSSALSCDEVTELAGLYVLDALEAADREIMREHLATCQQAHAEFAQLGGVVPALAALAEPVDAPPELKSRILAAMEREAAAANAGQAIQADASMRTPQPFSVRETERAARPAPIFALAGRRPWSWASVGVAVAAVLIVAVVGVWAIDAQSRSDRAGQRAQVLADALAALADPGSSVAILRPTTGQPGSAGFAALTADGMGYIVMTGLAAAPEGQAYQAWYIVDGQPSSAGLLAVDPDGFGVLSGVPALAGTDVVALTVEPAVGSVAPTSDPIVAGTVQPGG